MIGGLMIGGLLIDDWWEHRAPRREFNPAINNRQSPISKSFRGVGRRLALITALLACRPETTRPPFGPVTGAAETELELRVPAATRVLADALLADSLPVTKVEPRDGFIETPWFDTATGRPSANRRLGAGVVRVRAWVDPTRPGHSQLTVETLFRPLADPSLPERELDRQVPPNHPIRTRVRTILTQLTKQYGEPELADSVR